MRFLLLLPVMAIALPLPAAAQQPGQSGGAYGDQDSRPVVVTSAPETRPGQTADSFAGETGQRRTREQVAQDAGVEPMARIGGRIQNRTQNRIRNRIDRYYNPQANATSPFVVASEQARTAARRRR